MKKITAILCMVAMLSALALSFASCSFTADKGNKLIMATNAAFPPYEFKDDNGNIVGIDIEIAEKIAEKLGMTLEIKDVEFGSIISGVQSGKFDIGMAGMTVTEDRLVNVNFTKSYAKGVQSIIVKEGSAYTSCDDFYLLDSEGNYSAVKDGVKIGVQQDTTGDIYCSDTVKKYGFGEENVIRYKTGADAVQALISDKVTAVIIDNEPAKAFIAANSGLVILDGAYADEDYAICVAKSNTDLLNKINDALTELITDGTIKAILGKYIK